MDDLTKIERLKKILLGVWIFAALSFVPPFSSMPMAPLGTSLFWMLLVVHAIECVVFLGTLRSTSNPLIHELMQTLVFGVLHERSIRIRQRVD